MIPKIIHQMWLGDKRKQPFDCMNSVKEKHPEWKYMLWTEKNIQPLINQHKYKEVLRNNNCNESKYPKLADIVRYDKLFKYGGVYIDADSMCNKSFEELLDNEFFVAWENERKKPGIIANGIIGSIPNHPIMKRCIQVIGDLSSRTLCKKPAFKTTGPFLLTKVIREYGIEHVTVYPSWMFYPVHYTGYIYNKNIDPQKDSYTQQFWGSTSKVESPKVYRLIKHIGTHFGSGRSK